MYFNIITYFIFKYNYYLIKNTAFLKHSNRTGRNLQNEMSTFCFWLCFEHCTAYIAKSL